MSRHTSLAHHGSVGAYVAGFLLSGILTVIAYLAVVYRIADGMALIVVLMAFATLQLIVQVVFFLQLGREGKPRWNLVAFLFMLLVVVIVVAGSIWIMSNLNYNMGHSAMPEHQSDLQRQKGF